MADPTTQHRRLTSANSGSAGSTAARKHGDQAARDAQSKHQADSEAYKAFINAIDKADRDYEAQLTHALDRLDRENAAISHAWQLALRLADRAYDRIAKPAWERWRDDMAEAARIREAILAPVRDLVDDRTGKVQADFDDAVGRAGAIFQDEANAIAAFTSNVQTMGVPPDLSKGPVAANQ